MESPNNIAALIYLKDKVHKWKNIALLLAIFAVLVLIKSMFGDGLNDGMIDENAIASIKIDSVIFEDEHRSKVLKELAEKDSIKAVIININSPGGGIVGSEILYNDLRAIAAKKPTVVLMGSVAASGGYMAAIASDYIVAHNGTLTGSIGVLMEAPNVSALAQKIGVDVHTYKSAELKGAPNPFDKSNPNVDRVIQESINDSYQFFTGLVKERRGEKLNKKMLNIAFDGRAFTGRQAAQIGLIDKVGSKEDVIKYLESVKIDVKNLPIHDVEITEKDEKFLDKFLNILPFYNRVKNASRGEEIMAIMQ